MAKKQPKVLKYKPKQNKITVQDFRDTHIFGAGFPSDPFYVKLANDLFVKINYVFEGNPKMTEEYSKRAALSLAAYLEDLVSGSGIWAAFASLYEKKYGMKIPFYEADDILSDAPYDDEIPSLAAIRFILWYVANEATKSEIILNPQNPAICMLALELSEILLKAYDEAPESPARLGILPEEMMLKPVFFQIRDLCNWLCTGCYLTRCWDEDELTSNLRTFMMQLFKVKDDEELKDKADYGISSYLPFNALIGPLAITPQEWLCEIMELYPGDGEEQYIPIVKELVSRPFQFYQYEKIHEKSALITNLDGDVMEMSAYTMPGERFPEAIKEGSTAYMSLVYYDGDWMMNSIGLQPLPAEVFSQARVEYKERKKMEVESFKTAMKKLKKPIGVCKNYDDYMSHFHKDDKWKSKIPEKEYKELNDVDNLLYFVNSNGQISLLPDYADCVKLRGNKFYDKKAAEEDALNLIFDHTLGTDEFRQYLVDNNLIPDACLNSIISINVGKKLFQDNIRFFNDYSNRNTVKMQ